MDPADVVPLDDLSPADWLGRELVDFGSRVGEVVPTAGYDAVARVLHRDSGPDAEPGLWARIAAYSGTTLHPLAQYQMLGGLDRRSVADRRWPESMAPIPEEGSLDRASLAILRDVLAVHTATPDRCWFALWEGFGGLPDAWRSARTFALPGRSFHLFTGTVSDVVEISVEFECAGIAAGGQGAAWFSLATETGEPVQPRDWAEVAERWRAGGILQSPSLWWPEDHAWCVASEIDFDSTLVAGSAALVAELVAHPDLEAFEVAPGDSLAVDADTVNGR